MQKIFLTLLVVACATTALWANGIEIDGIHYLLAGDSAEVTYTGALNSSGTYSGDLIIPASVTYNQQCYRVTSIGKCALRECDSLKSVTIPDVVKIIKEDAFRRSKNLISVFIPNSVKSIGNSAFQECYSLSSITIPNSVESLGSGAFFNCSAITSITCCANIPPSCGAYTFAQISDSIPVYVPKKNVDAYQSAEEWKKFKNIIGIGYTITTIAEHGTIIGGGEILFSEQITLTAIPDTDYHFAQWSDGNKDNPRIATITQDTTFTTVFEKNYSGTCGNNLYWQYDNYSLFISGSGKMINYDSENVPWKLFRDSISSVSLSSECTSIGSYAFYACSALSSINIPDSVLTIGKYAFSQCTSLPIIDNVRYADTYLVEAVDKEGQTTSFAIKDGTRWIGDDAFYGSNMVAISLPQSLDYIGFNAFRECSGLADIYCYDTIPPLIANNNTIQGVSRHCYIHVPSGSMRDYQMAFGWRDFYHFFEITDLPAGQTEVGVTVTNNYATFSWPVNPTASSYTLEITKGGELFCTLIFNTMGQLVGMAFAPGRGANKVTAAESNAYGYSFVVTGLENNTTYDFTFTTKDSQGIVIETKGGKFKTDETTFFDAVEGNVKNQSPKLLRNGNLLIERNGVYYNAQGAVVE